MTQIKKNTMNPIKNGSRHKQSLKNHTTLMPHVFFFFWLKKETTQVNKSQGYSQSIPKDLPKINTLIDQKYWDKKPTTTIHITPKNETR